METEKFLFVTNKAKVVVCGLYLWANTAANTGPEGQTGLLVTGLQDTTSSSLWKEQSRTCILCPQGGSKEKENLRE